MIPNSDKQETEAAARAEVDNSIFAARSVAVWFLEVTGLF